ncbi:hypothetical protein JYB64_20990 [Algoriphagus aestuarii]|nr:hypothetical protein [Algoriphagus aestuarii]
MNNNSILKGYLVHFVYVPIAIVNSLINGEDINVLGLIIFITILIGFIAFGFNYSITILGLSLFKNKCIFAFLLPTMVAAGLYYPINELLQYLDFGGNSIYLLFLGISIFVNIGTFIFLRFKNSKIQ